ncbi:MAG: cytochrome c oxidase subunit II [Acidimicrobiales bacterium]
MRLPAAVAAAVGVLLAGCGGSRYFAPDPASKDGREVLDLWQLTFVTALAVGGIVYALIIFALVRYRRRGDEIPDQRHEHIPLELVYTAIPVAIVAVLFGVNVLNEQRVSALSDRPDLEVEVLGFQWQWQFTYLDEDITLTGVPNQPVELVLPVDQTIRLHLVAEDVIHSFWVPEFFEKRDLIPGVDNEIDITPTRQGTYTGRCAEFCGLDHWRMTFAVRVVSAAEFETWVAERADGGGG